jgi:DNA polymerase bacteriophage-type
VSSRLIGIRCDIETRSSVPIKNGVYCYAESPDFRVLHIAYSPLRQFAGGAVKMGTPRLLDEDDTASVIQFQQILMNPGFQKHAFNAAFERVCLSKWIGLPNGEYIDPENWHCAAIRANVNGVFGTLEEVGRALRSPVKKDPEGKKLIRLFSVPDKKTGLFADPADHPQEFARFGDPYCTQDVLTEAGVAALLPDIPEFVQAEYEADQRINDRGFRHFRGLSQQAVAQVKTEQTRLMGELKTLTGLENPNSQQQMTRWLEEQGYPMVSLDKDHRAEALADPFVPEHVAEVLTLKGAASLSSVTKHTAALNTRCSDGRIRGSLQFYGAHTGREAGRGIQPQNLPRAEASAQDRVRLLRGQAGADAPEIAKGTVRSSIVPARDHVFAGADYNAIEARTLGWASGEAWVNTEFAGQGKIYEATAEMMFGSPTKAEIIAGRKGCDECGKCLPCITRAKGKVSNLALGYAGGAGALVKMGAEGAGIDIGNYKELNAEWHAVGAPGKFHEWNRDLHDYPELLRLRDLYRDASPATVRFWKLCAKAWDIAAAGKGARFGSSQQFAMIRDGRHNRLILPSGRSIWYRHARAHIDPNNPERIDYRTFIGKSGGIGHTRIETHGGSLTENINQAVARDVLFDLIMKIEALTARGWPGRIVLHVHDEVLIEVHKKHAEQVLADVLGLMSTPPDWAPGLAVQGAGGIMERYKK